MIANDIEFRQTLESLGLMYKALADLRATVWPQNPKLFAIMAEGPLDYIRDFKHDLDEYTGVPLAERLLAEPPPGRADSTIPVPVAVG